MKLLSWLEKNTSLPFPILFLLLMAFGGMGIFCLLVIYTVVINIPPNMDTTILGTVDFRSVDF